METKPSTSQSITDKEWLDLAWKHFQQHAQQRILYFNYFVIFSTILTTGLVTTFQNDFQAPYLGIGIGIIQSFLAYIFFKIDSRNRFLTRHAENVIKAVETDYELQGKKSYLLFTNEENETLKQKQKDAKSFFLFRQISHGKSYKIIFIAFFIIGIIGAIISFINLNRISRITSNKDAIIKTCEVESKENDSVNKVLKKQDSVLEVMFIDIKKINLRFDSLDMINFKTYKSK